MKETGVERKTVQIDSRTARSWFLMNNPVKKHPKTPVSSTPSRHSTGGQGENSPGFTTPTTPTLQQENTPLLYQKSTPVLEHNMTSPESGDSKPEVHNSGDRKQEVDLSPLSLSDSSRTSVGDTSSSCLWSCTTSSSNTSSNDNSSISEPSPNGGASPFEKRRRRSGYHHIHRSPSPPTVSALSLGSSSPDEEHDSPSQRDSSSDSDFEPFVPLVQTFCPANVSPEFSPDVDEQYKTFNDVFHLGNLCASVEENADCEFFLPGVAALHGPPPDTCKYTSMSSVNTSNSENDPPAPPSSPMSCTPLGPPGIGYPFLSSGSSSSAWSPVNEQGLFPNPDIDIVVLDDVTEIQGETGGQSRDTAQRTELNQNDDEPQENQATATSLTENNEENQTERDEDRTGSITGSDSEVETDKDRDNDRDRNKEANSDYLRDSDREGDRDSEEGKNSETEGASESVPPGTSHREASVIEREADNGLKGKSAATEDHSSEAIPQHNSEVECEDSHKDPQETQKAEDSEPLSHTDLLATRMEETKILKRRIDTVMFVFLGLFTLTKDNKVTQTAKEWFQNTTFFLSKDEIGTDDWPVQPPMDTEARAQDMVIYVDKVCKYYLTAKTRMEETLQRIVTEMQQHSFLEKTTQATQTLLEFCQGKEPSPEDTTQHPYFRRNVLCLMGRVEERVLKSYSGHPFDKPLPSGWCDSDEWKEAGQDVLAFVNQHWKERAPPSQDNDRGSKREEADNANQRDHNAQTGGEIQQTHSSESVTPGTSHREASVIEREADNGLKGKSAAAEDHSSEAIPQHNSEVECEDSHKDSQETQKAENSEPLSHTDLLASKMEETKILRSRIRTVILVFVKYISQTEDSSVNETFREMFEKSVVRYIRENRYWMNYRSFDKLQAQDMEESDKVIHLDKVNKHLVQWKKILEETLERFREETQQHNWDQTTQVTKMALDFCQGKEASPEDTTQCPELRKVVLRLMGKVDQVLQKFYSEHPFDKPQAPGFYDEWEGVTDKLTTIIQLFWKKRASQASTTMQETDHGLKGTASTEDQDPEATRQDTSEVEPEEDSQRDSEEESQCSESLKTEGTHKPVKDSEPQSLLNLLVSKLEEMNFLLNRIDTGLLGMKALVNRVDEDCIDEEFLADYEEMADLFTHFDHWAVLREGDEEYIGIEDLELSEQLDSIDDTNEYLLDWKEDMEDTLVWLKEQVKRVNFYEEITDMAEKVTEHGKAEGCCEGSVSEECREFRNVVELTNTVKVKFIDFQAENPVNREEAFTSIEQSGLYPEWERVRQEVVPFMHHSHSPAAGQSRAVGRDRYCERGSERDWDSESDIEMDLNSERNRQSEGGSERDWVSERDIEMDLDSERNSRSEGGSGSDGDEDNVRYKHGDGEGDVLEDRDAERTNNSEESEVCKKDKEGDRGKGSEGDSESDSTRDRDNLRDTDTRSLTIAEEKQDTETHREHARNIGQETLAMRCCPYIPKPTNLHQISKRIIQLETGIRMQLTSPPCFDTPDLYRDLYDQFWRIRETWVPLVDVWSPLYAHTEGLKVHEQVEAVDAMKKKLQECETEFEDLWRKLRERVENSPASHTGASGVSEERKGNVSAIPPPPLPPPPMFSSTARQSELQIQEQEEQTEETTEGNKPARPPPPPAPPPPPLPSSLQQQSLFNNHTKQQAPGETTADGDLCNALIAIIEAKAFTACRLGFTIRGVKTSAEALLRDLGDEAGNFGAGTRMMRAVYEAMQPKWRACAWRPLHMRSSESKPGRESANLLLKISAYFDEVISQFKSHLHKFQNFEEMLGEAKEWLGETQEDEERENTEEEKHDLNHEVMTEAGETALSKKILWINVEKIEVLEAQIQAYLTALPNKKTALHSEHRELCATWKPLVNDVWYEVYVEMEDMDEEARAKKIRELKRTLRKCKAQLEDLLKRLDEEVHKDLKCDGCNGEVDKETTQVLRKGADSKEVATESVSSALPIVPPFVQPCVLPPPVPTPPQPPPSVPTVPAPAPQTVVSREPDKRAGPHDSPCVSMRRGGDRCASFHMNMEFTEPERFKDDETDTEISTSKQEDITKAPAPQAEPKVELSREEKEHLEKFLNPESERRSETGSAENRTNQSNDRRPSFYLDIWQITEPDRFKNDETNADDGISTSNAQDTITALAPEAVAKLEPSGAKKGQEDKFSNQEARMSAASSDSSTSEGNGRRPSFYVNIKKIMKPARFHPDLEQLRVVNLKKLQKESLEQPEEVQENVHLEFSSLSSRKQQQSAQFPKNQTVKKPVTFQLQSQLYKNLKEPENLGEQTPQDVNFRSALPTPQSPTESRATCMQTKTPQLQEQESVVTRGAQKTPGRQAVDIGKLIRPARFNPELHVKKNLEELDKNPAQSVTTQRISTQVVKLNPTQVVKVNPSQGVKLNPTQGVKPEPCLPQSQQSPGRRKTPLDMTKAASDTPKATIHQAGLQQHPRVRSTPQKLATVSVKQILRPATLQAEQQQEENSEETQNPKIKIIHELKSNLEHWERKPAQGSKANPAPQEPDKPRVTPTTTEKLEHTAEHEKVQRIKRVFRDQARLLLALQRCQEDEATSKTLDMASSVRCRHPCGTSPRDELRKKYPAMEELRAQEVSSPNKEAKQRQNQCGTPPRNELRNRYPAMGELKQSHLPYEKGPRAMSLKDIAQVLKTKRHPQFPVPESTAPAPPSEAPQNCTKSPVPKSPKRPVPKSPQCPSGPKCSECPPGPKCPMWPPVPKSPEWMKQGKQDVGLKTLQSATKARVALQFQELETQPQAPHTYADVLKPPAWMQQCKPDTPRLQKEEEIFLNDAAEFPEMQRKMKGHVGVPKVRLQGQWKAGKPQIQHVVKSAQPVPQPRVPEQHKLKDPGQPAVRHTRAPEVCLQDYSTTNGEKPEKQQLMDSVPPLPQINVHDEPETQDATKGVQPVQELHLEEEQNSMNSADTEESESGEQEEQGEPQSSVEDVETQRTYADKVKFRPPVPPLALRSRVRSTIRRNVSSKSSRTGTVIRKVSSAGHRPRAASKCPRKIKMKKQNSPAGWLSRFSGEESEVATPRSDDSLAWASASEWLTPRERGPTLPGKGQLLRPEISLVDQWDNLSEISLGSNKCVAEELGDLSESVEEEKSWPASVKSPQKMATDFFGKWLTCAKEFSQGLIKDIRNALNKTPGRPALSTRRLVARTALSSASDDANWREVPLLAAPSQSVSPRPLPVSAAPSEESLYFTARGPEDHVGDHVGEATLDDVENLRHKAQSELAAEIRELAKMFEFHCKVYLPAEDVTNEDNEKQKKPEKCVSQRHIHSLRLRERERPTGTEFSRLYSWTSRVQQTMLHDSEGLPTLTFPTTQPRLTLAMQNKARHTYSLDLCRTTPLDGEMQQILNRTKSFTSHSYQVDMSRGEVGDVRQYVVCRNTDMADVHRHKFNRWKQEKIDLSAAFHDPECNWPEFARKMGYSTPASPVNEQVGGTKNQIAEFKIKSAKILQKVKENLNNEIKKAKKVVDADESTDDPNKEPATPTVREMIQETTKMKAAQEEDKKAEKVREKDVAKQERNEQTVEKPTPKKPQNGEDIDTIVEKIFVGNKVNKRKPTEEKVQNKQQQKHKEAKKNKKEGVGRAKEQHHQATPRRLQTFLPHLRPTSPHQAPSSPSKASPKESTPAQVPPTEIQLASTQAPEICPPAQPSSPSPSPNLYGPAFVLKRGPFCAYGPTIQHCHNTQSPVSPSSKNQFAPPASMGTAASPVPLSTPTSAVPKVQPSPTSPSPTLYGPAFVLKRGPFCAYGPTIQHCHNTQLPVPPSSKDQLAPPTSMGTAAPPAPLGTPTSPVPKVTVPKVAVTVSVLKDTPASTAVDQGTPGSPVPESKLKHWPPKTAPVGPHPRGTAVPPVPRVAPATGTTKLTSWPPKVVPTRPDPSAIPPPSIPRGSPDHPTPNGTLVAPAPENIRARPVPNNTHQVHTSPAFKGTATPHVLPNGIPISPAPKGIVIPQTPEGKPTSPSGKGTTPTAASPIPRPTPLMSVRTTPPPPTLPPSRQWGPPETGDGGWAALNLRIGLLADPESCRLIHVDSVTLKRSTYKSEWKVSEPQGNVAPDA